MTSVCLSVRRESQHNMFHTRVSLLQMVDGPADGVIELYERDVVVKAVCSSTAAEYTVLSFIARMLCISD